jgi:hypothetical protein
VELTTNAYLVPSGVNNKCAKASKSERNMGCEELEEKTTDDGSFIPTSSFGSNKKTKEFGVRYNIWKFGMGGIKGTKDKIAYK